MFIPQYEETLNFIRETLEERERDDLYTMKLAKARGEARTKEDGDSERIEVGT